MGSPASTLSHAGKAQRQDECHADEDRGSPLGHADQCEPHSPGPEKHHGENGTPSVETAGLELGGAHEGSGKGREEVGRTDAG